MEEAEAVLLLVAMGVDDHPLETTVDLAGDLQADTLLPAALLVATDDPLLVGVLVAQCVTADLHHEDLVVTAALLPVTDLTGVVVALPPEDQVITAGHHRAVALALLLVEATLLLLAGNIPPHLKEAILLHLIEVTVVLLLGATPHLVALHAGVLHLEVALLQGAGVPHLADPLLAAALADDHTKVLRRNRGCFRHWKHP
mmetsp:Transcript_11429/g.21772  ORF Transcript_11429/g.21772 Transcript_11429/m.21772 type:complete len:200 (+) Transcript_11429:864-1463(+)